MQDRLISFVETLKTDRKISSYDETTTKQAVVEKLLSLLGWDTFNADEVKKEYSIGGKRVDYSLRIGDQNKVFIEAKKTGEDLEKHLKQLLDYSFEQGIKLSVLTNGTDWWFYLSLLDEVWEKRKFYAIDILQQESKDIVTKFIDFLSRDNVDSGKSIQNAEETYKNRKKINILNETLPKAWNKVIQENDDSLVDLIRETAEKLCGFKADDEQIKRFIQQHKDKWIIDSTIEAKIPTLKNKKTASKGKGEKKPGIIQTIYDLVVNKGPISREKILEHLVNLFPDRDPKGMNNTIGIQLPARMSKERGINIVKTEKGYMVVDN